MIQQSVNQLINTLGIGLRLSPRYEERQEARSAINKAKIAQSGLEDIAKNLENPDKEYTETELKDIQARVGEHNRNVYTAKTLGESNPYAKKGASKLPSQKTYSPMLSSIESNLEKRFKAMENMREKANTAIQQDNDFKQTRSMILDKLGQQIIKEK